MEWTTASLGTSVGMVGAGILAIVVAAGLAVFGGGSDPIELQGTPAAADHGISAASVAAATGLSLLALGAVGAAVTLGVVLAPTSRDITWEETSS